MMKLLFRLMALGGAMAFAAICGVAQDSGDKHWKAQWITAPGVAERDSVVLHFRKLVELGTAPTRFLVDVSADNQFVLHGNGKEAGRGPSRADLGHWRYETYDIGPMLHVGKNILAATVWHFGTHAAIAQMSERTGFLLHGAGEAESAADTNASWDVEEESGITTLRPRVKGYFAAEPGLQIDGAKWDWDAANGNHGNVAAERAFPQRLKPQVEGLANVGAKAPPPKSVRRAEADHEAQRKWAKAVTLGRGALRYEQDAPNNWQLVADRLPAMEMTEVPAGKVVRTSCAMLSRGFPREEISLPAHSTCSLLLDNGELTTGYPALTVSQGHGTAIRLTYAEALVDTKGEKGNRNQIQGKHIEGVVDEFLPGGGESKREFSPLSWRTWRYMQMDVQTHAEQVRIEGMKTWFSGYPFVEHGDFHADDAGLDSIWKIGWRTARWEAHATY